METVSPQSRIYASAVLKVARKHIKPTELTVIVSPEMLAQNAERAAEVGLTLGEAVSFLLSGPWSARSITNRTEHYEWVLKNLIMDKAIASVTPKGKALRDALREFEKEAGAAPLMLKEEAA